MISDRYLKAKQKAHELVDSDKFQNDVRAIRKRWHITPTQAPMLASDPSEWLVTHKDIASEFYEDIKTTFYLKSDYKLTAASFDALVRYILHDDYYTFSGGYPMIVEYNHLQSGKSYFQLSFYEHTTEQEIINAFRSFKNDLEPRKADYSLPAKKHEKMRLAYKLNKEGMPTKDIVMEINKKYKSKDTYVEVNRYIQEYKKRLPK